MNQRREYFIENGKERHLSTSHMVVGAMWASRHVGIGRTTYYRLIKTGQLRTIPNTKKTTPANIWECWMKGLM